MFGVYLMFAMSLTITNTYLQNVFLTSGGLRYLFAFDKALVCGMTSTMNVLKADMGIYLFMASIF